MSFRAWCLAAAIGLIATLGQAQENSGEPDREAEQEYGQIGVIPLPLPVEIVEEQPTADARERHEEEARQREIEDLAAQKGMYRAAQAMNALTKDMRDYALYSTIAVGFGTLLLFGTLSIALQQNRVTERLGRIQLRPYVAVHAAKWGLGSNERPNAITDIQARIAISNAGQTPAKNVCLYRCEKTLGTEVATEDRIDDAIAKAPAVAIQFSIEAGGPIGYQIDNVASEDEALSLVETECHSYFMGRITYSDVFGDNHETTWCLRVENFGTDRVRIFPYKYGNRST